MKKEKSEKTFQASYGTEIALVFMGGILARSTMIVEKNIARSIDELEVECRYIHETKKTTKPFLH